MTDENDVEALQNYVEKNSEVKERVIADLIRDETRVKDRENLLQLHFKSCQQMKLLRVFLSTVRDSTLPLIA